MNNQSCDESPGRSRLGRARYYTNVSVVGAARYYVRREPGRGGGGGKRGKIVGRLRVFIFGAGGVEVATMINRKTAAAFVLTVIPPGEARGDGKSG